MDAETEELCEVVVFMMHQTLWETVSPIKWSHAAPQTDKLTAVDDFEDEALMILINWIVREIGVWMRTLTRWSTRW